MLGGYMTTLSDIADMLKSARREAGLSQGELAQRAGVARARPWLAWRPWPRAT